MEVHHAAPGYSLHVYWCTGVQVYRDILVEVHQAGHVDGTYRVTCVFAYHFTGRSGYTGGSTFIFSWTRSVHMYGGTFEPVYRK